MYSTIFGLDKINYNFKLLFQISSKFILLSSLGLIFALITLSPKYFLTKHLLWIVFISLIGFFYYPIYKNNKIFFYHTSISTFVLILLLSLTAFLKPNWIGDNWALPLTIGLIVLIIAKICEIYLNKYYNKSNEKHNVLYSYFIIIIFSLWTLYDTKNILKNANNCVNPDYINQSLDIFINSINMFNGVAGIPK